MGSLEPAQIGRYLRLDARIGFTEEVLQQDVFGGNGGIGFQLEYPVSVLALSMEQSRHGFFDAALETRLQKLGRRQTRGSPASRHYRALT